jgi:ribosome-associated toxin RatA of RatAB toxin-antitoxin module
LKEIEGRAHLAVDASPESCFALLEAVEEYPSWSDGLVRSVEVLASDAEGGARTVRVVLHVSHSAIHRDIETVMSVRRRPPEAVELERLANEPSDPERLELSWHLRPGERTEVELRFRAVVSVPSLVPLPRVGDGVAERLLGAAARRLQRG